MKAPSREAVVRATRRVLQAYPRVKVAILYGSAARDRLTEESDIDLAVGAGSELSWGEKQALQLALSDAVGREVDLVDLETLTGLLWEILWTEGLFLIKDHDLVVRYTGKVQAFVEDVKPAMMRIIEQRLEKAWGNHEP